MPKSVVKHAVFLTGLLLVVIVTLFILSPVALAAVFPGTIFTSAGTGTEGYNGDGIPATDAWLNAPYGVVQDGNGNLYIADTFNNRIRKIDTSGTISTVAGTGVEGYSGDGMAATDAQLYRPIGITTDGNGNLYFTDVYNNCIRKVDTSGIITTVAGTGTEGYNGDGIQATDAQLYRPLGITVDGEGNLYIADTYNYRIRKVDALSGIITTVAGTGTDGYNGDGINATSAQIRASNDVTVDENGNLYIADTWNQRIRKVDTSGIITTIAGTGTAGYNGDGINATSAQLNGPSVITMDKNGNLYFSDFYNNRVRKVNKSGIISTIAGTGIAGYNGDEMAAINAQLDNPVGVAMSMNGNLYIGDMGNNRVREIINVVDPDPPITASVTVPSDAATYTPDSIPPYLTGIVADNLDGAGIRADSTVFSIYRASDQMYWTKHGWQKGESWLPTEHPESTDGSEVTWEGACVLPYWRTGDYTIQARATDRFNQSFTGVPATFSFQEPQAAVIGDVNRDGIVNVLDITEIVKIILKIPPYDN
ncbi:MAG: SMP-30/gluconolactonase/LRE family protein [Dehalococcoidales bacterium]|nr:SMP-30/gluconolactonase/LRE family protein [Dehalococcoidales bacterium]